MGLSAHRAIAAVLIGTCTACQSTPAASPDWERSGSPTTTASAVPTSHSASTDIPPTQARRQLTYDCASGELDLTKTAAADPGDYSACVKPGTRIRMRLTAVVGAWAELSNTSADTVQITNQQIAPTGGLGAQLRASTAGVSTLKTTSLHAGDPHGPPSYVWSLELTVRY